MTMYRIASIAAVATLASLAGAAASVPTPPALACIVSHVSPDDGSAQAVCDDGTHWVYDADGQPYANVAGAPVREPGWYQQ